MTTAHAKDPEESELDALLDAILEVYHYDFRRYERSHIARRVVRAQAALGASTIGELRRRIIGDAGAFTGLLRELTIQVSDMFRDPEAFAVLRREVMPYLATYPSPRVWIAGCGAGEEAYSLAILLEEEGLLDRSLVYATDIDADSLRAGAAATYDLERVRGFSENYFLSGGKASLSDYYTAAYGRAVFNQRLKKHILFSDHSLVTDAAFAEVMLVSCRNVLIYFDRVLQDRVIGLFRAALCPRGFLLLGTKESLLFSRHGDVFEEVAASQRIYRLKSEGTWPRA